LVVQEQIDDAEYFLSILRTKYERNEMRPNLTAFLALARSIPDYLLENYNKKFGVNIPLSKKLTINNFRKKAGRDINHHPRFRFKNEPWDYVVNGLRLNFVDQVMDWYL
jgi:hypothetical protein